MIPLNPGLLVPYLQKEACKPTGQPPPNIPAPPRPALMGDSAGSGVPVAEKIEVLMPSIDKVEKTDLSKLSPVANLLDNAFIANWYSNLSSQPNNNHQIGRSLNKFA